MNLMSCDHVLILHLKGVPHKLKKEFDACDAKSAFYCRCSLCSAQYPTQQGLLQHRQAYHKEPAVQPGAELAIPVVDLKAPGALNRLAGLGIHHYVPLSQLVSQSGGYFGLPIVSVDGARNPAVCNLGGLGASSVLSLGPLKQLGR